MKSLPIVVGFAAFVMSFTLAGGVLSAQAVPVALAASTSECFCPVVKCGGGTAASCKVNCEAPERAQCDCTACKNNAPGDNRCACVK